MPATNWINANVEIDGRSDGPRSVVLQATPGAAYGAVVKVFPAGGAVRRSQIGGVHVYRPGEGSPAASVFFAEAYDADDFVLDLARAAGQVIPHASPELRDELIPAIPNAQKLLDAIHKLKAPAAFKDVLFEQFAA